MKIASFNINNIRKRLPNLLAWLDESAPDVVCLQELKATDAAFPIEAWVVRETHSHPDRFTATFRFLLDRFIELRPSVG